MSGRIPPLYCTLILLIAMQGHQKNSKNKTETIQTKNYMFLNGMLTPDYNECLSYQEKEGSWLFIFVVFVLFLINLLCFHARVGALLCTTVHVHVPPSLPDLFLHVFWVASTLFVVEDNNRIVRRAEEVLLE